MNRAATPPSSWPDRLEGYNNILKALFASDIRKNVHDGKTLLSRLLEEGIAERALSLTPLWPPICSRPPMGAMNWKNWA